jgi:hypothetical protein
VITARRFTQTAFMPVGYAVMVAAVLLRDRMPATEVVSLPGEMVAVITCLSAPTVVVLIRAMIDAVMTVVATLLILVRTAIVSTMVTVLMRHRLAVRVITLVCP